MLKSDMGFTLRELLYEVSYQNLLMLSSSLPAYKSSDSGKKQNRGRRPFNPNAPERGNAGSLAGLFTKLRGQK